MSAFRAHRPNRPIMRSKSNLNLRTSEAYNSTERCGFETEFPLPIVVDEEMVTPFKYWNGTIHEGMYYSNELYRYDQAYDLDERLKAYENAYTQAELGLTVCITVSKDSYKLWTGLRSLSSQNIVREDNCPNL